MKKLILILTAIFALISCKNENKTDENNTPLAAEKVIDSVFTITLNATVKKDDSFQVYYRKSSENAYTETSSVFTELKGSDKPQDIIFRLPEGIIPDFIRMDFGTNKDQSSLTINNFKMSYFGKIFQVKGVDFFKFLLVEQKTASFDASNGIITPTTLNGNHDPQSSSEKALYDEIQKIVK